MSDNFLHIHKSVLKKDFSIFLLIIPLIAFALTIALLFSKLNHFSSTAYSSRSDTAVLGENDEKP